METIWLKEALSAGMTDRAFKLGTVLTLGWFWTRIGGCSVLYRGTSIETTDFENILAIADKDAEQISPPAYVQHNSNTTYFYVVRRVNNCGYQEHTLAAAVRVAIDANGDLCQLQPNSIFVTRAEQAADNKIQLIWFYCPIEQKSAPVCFNVYYDNGTGQIDYENPLATVDYTSRRFYGYQSDVLQGGKYLFAIRTQDAAGTENNSLAQLNIQLDTTNPGAIDVLSVKAF
jgi:hypothetical protein